jgi:hypothetical protein
MFNTHTHACEFMTSKTSWHTKKWHAMRNIGAINSKHTKTYGITKKHGLPWKFVHLVTKSHAMSSSHRRSNRY